MLFRCLSKEEVWRALPRQRFKILLISMCFNGWMEKVLDACVDEMYPMEKGVFIDRPEEIVLQCGDGYLTRRQIKHIVENRKAERGSARDIKQYRVVYAYFLLLKKLNASAAGKTPHPKDILMG
jgi:hypothetical protein